MKKYIVSITLGILTLRILASASPVYASIVCPNCGPLGSGTPQGALAIAVANIWRASLVIASIAFVLYFAWGAMRWMTAEGDKAKFEEGRHKIANALIGLILIAASVAIVRLLGELFDIRFLQTLVFEFPTP